MTMRVERKREVNFLRPLPPGSYDLTLKSKR